VKADAEADMPSAETSGASCVQRFDGSRNSAIHTTYRISLRSSSIREPRYPLLRVVSGCLWAAKRVFDARTCLLQAWRFGGGGGVGGGPVWRRRAEAGAGVSPGAPISSARWAGHRATP
jgi:hypothetical protein